MLFPWQLGVWLLPVQKLGKHWRNPVSSGPFLVLRRHVLMNWSQNCLYLVYYEHVHAKERWCNARFCQLRRAIKVQQRQKTAEKLSNKLQWETLYSKLHVDSEKQTKENVLLSEPHSFGVNISNCYVLGMILTSFFLVIVPFWFHMQKKRKQRLINQSLIANLGHDFGPQTRYFPDVPKSDRLIWFLCVSAIILIPLQYFTS